MKLHAVTLESGRNAGLRLRQGLDGWFCDVGCGQKNVSTKLSQKLIAFTKNTVVLGFRVLGFSALPGFRALKAGDGAWSVHKTLFGFRAPLSQLCIY